MFLFELSMILGSVITVVITDRNPNSITKLGVFFLTSTLVYFLLCVCLFVGKVLT